MNIQMLNRICLLSAFIFLNITLSAQTDSTLLPLMNYSDQREYIIQDIKVTGVEFTDPRILVQMTGLVVGKSVTIPGDAISKIVEKFWDHGLFSDIKIIATKIEGENIWLEIKLKEKPRISTFDIKGVKKGDVEDLKEKLGVKPGKELTDNTLNTIQYLIKDHYREKGFLNTKVTFTQVKDTVYQNRIKLTAHIDKNEKIKIAHIEFYGNTYYSDRRLRRTFKKTHQKSFNIFKGTKYIEKEYKEDKKKLAEFYKKNGYRDYKFLSDSFTYKNKKRINLFVSIQEGNQFHIRNISWIGNTKYPTEYLNRLLMMKKGDVYDQVALNKRLLSDEDAVQSLYSDNGYLFSSIDPVETKIEGDSIDLEMRVTEGKQATINRIIITGNDKTNEHVVRRELYTRPGDLFSKSAIIRSVRELGQLGFFNPEKIEPIPLPNMTDGTVDIQYKLEEKSSDQLEVSGGWGAGMLVGTLGLRFSNFSAKNLFNPKAYRPIPSGDGQSLSLRAQSNGSWYKAYSMSFTEPWFGGKKRNSFSFSAYYTVQNSYGTSFYQTSDQSFKVSGASIGLGRRLKWPDDNFTLYNEIAYQNYTLKNWGTSFLFSNGYSQNLSFKIQLSRNTTDQPIYPRSGSNISISVQLTPPFSLFKKDDFWKLSNSEVKDFEDNIRANNAIQRLNSDYITSYNLKYLDEEVYYAEQARKYKWIEYHKWNFKATWYNTLYKNLVLSFNTQFGYLGYYSRNLGYSPFEGFVLGGDGFSGYSLYGKETIALRGYENESLTAPVNFIDFYQGQKRVRLGQGVSNIYNKVTVELRYPITLQPSATIYGLVFAEGGNSWYKFEDFNPFLIKRSVGFGIRAFLPMFGMLGIDWGYGFDKDNMPGTTGPSRGQFHFVMGQQF